MRMWGTRTAALGGLALRARDDDLDEWMLVLAGMNGLDALLDLAAIRDGCRAAQRLQPPRPPRCSPR